MIDTQPTTRYEDLPDLLTVNECADYLRRGRSATYESMKRGEIKHIRLGRKILIPKVYLTAEALLESSSAV